MEIFDLKQWFSQFLFPESILTRNWITISRNLFWRQGKYNM